MGVKEIPRELAAVAAGHVQPKDRITVIDTAKGPVFVTPRRYAFGRCEATALLPNRAAYTQIACAY